MLLYCKAGGRCLLAIYCFCSLEGTRVSKGRTALFLMHIALPLTLDRLRLLGRTSGVTITAAEKRFAVSAASDAGAEMQTYRDQLRQMTMAHKGSSRSDVRKYARLVDELAQHDQCLGDLPLDPSVVSGGADSRAHDAPAKAALVHVWLLDRVLCACCCCCSMRVLPSENATCDKSEAKPLNSKP